MGFLDALIGRSKQAAPNLDNLFGLPSAQITLQAAECIAPVRRAGVCFKPSVGQAFDKTEAELLQLLQLDDSTSTSPATLEVTKEVDEFGYQWIVVASDDFETLVTRVHMVNSTLEEHGYGPQLLCSVVGFAAVASDAGVAMATGPATTYLVYLYKRGTFYPFVPKDGEKRDNEAELRLKVELAHDLKIEPDLDRWFPIWKLPIN